MKAVHFRSLEKYLFWISAACLSNPFVLYWQHLSYSCTRLYSTTDQVDLEVRGFPISLARKSRSVEIYRWKFGGCAGEGRRGNTMEEWEKLLLEPNVGKIASACQLAFSTSFTIMYLTVPSDSGFGSCPKVTLPLPAHVTCFWPQEQWRLTVSV